MSLLLYDDFKSMLHLKFYIHSSCDGVCFCQTILLIIRQIPISETLKCDKIPISETETTWHFPRLKCPCVLGLAPKEGLGAGHSPYCHSWRNGERCPYDVTFGGPVAQGEL